MGAQRTYHNPDASDDLRVCSPDWTRTSNLPLLTEQFDVDDYGPILSSSNGIGTGGYLQMSTDSDQ